MSEVEDAIPLSDKIEGAPHPSKAERIFGHETASKEFLDLFAASRLPHGWLLCGPRGVGKATLAWQITKFLLTMPDLNLDSDLLGGPLKIPRRLKFRPIIQFQDELQQGPSPVFL